MDDLARGWAIVMEHWHSRDLAFWIAIMVPCAIAIWMPIFAKRRRRSGEEAEDEAMTPKKRAPLPGPERGFRS